MTGGIWRLILAAGILAAGVVGAWLLSRSSRWRGAGPMALLVTAPLVPHLEIVSRLSTDDLLPLLGLGMLVLTVHPPRLTKSNLLRAGLLGVLVAIVARIASTIAHEPSLVDMLMTMTAAVARPLFLVATTTYVAISLRRADRRAWVAGAIGILGTFEALFSLVMFSIPVPGVGVRPGLPYEHLSGCGFRITGTLGLSANHIGAIFVVTLPVTVGLAIAERGRRQLLWAAAAAVQATALYFTFTRASILLGGAAAVLVLLYYVRFKLLLLIAAMSALLLFGALSLDCSTAPVVHPPPSASYAPPSAAYTPPTASRTPAPSQSGGGDAVIERFADPSDRLALWYAAARITLDYPVLGVGIGHMVDVMRSDPGRYVTTPFGNATNSAHNTILLAGAETGIPGALGTLLVNVVLSLVALGAIAFRRSSPAVVACGFAALAFLAQGMVNNLFTVPATGTLLALVVGLIIAMDTGTSAEHGGGHP